MKPERKRELLQIALKSGNELACIGKVRYSEEASAKKAAKKMNERVDVTKELIHYPCPFCYGWHVGRKKEEASNAD